MSTTNDLHREVQDWRNRALLAEAQLATYSRRRPHSLPMMDAAGNPAQPLLGTTPEQE